MYYKGHGEVKVDIMLLLIANNCWTRSFALGYWLFYFSSVFDSDEERKPLQEKDFSSEYVCCLFTFALIGDRQFRQSVKILCWTICWIKHGKAHVISPCLIFAFKSVFTFLRCTNNALWWVIMNSYDSTISCWLFLLFMARSARFVLLDGL
jgi:hypothetical protein